MIKEFLQSDYIYWSGESIHEDRKPGRFKDQIKYSSDCFDSEE